MKKIKLGFADKYSAFVPQEDLMYKLIARHFDIELCDDPDYLIYGQFGDSHLYRDNCVKIAYSGENTAPDFNEADYAVGSDDICFGDRYCRFPVFVDCDEFALMRNREQLVGVPSRDDLLNRKFCSFVVSNSSSQNPMREVFFRELSKYKRVDSGGRYLNNLPDGKPVPDKIAFCRQYKFNIAFENSSVPGYVTEKLVQPLTHYTVPIYWGAPDVERDFNANCMVVVKDQKDIGRAIDEIVYLDTHDDEYLKRATSKCLVKDVYSYEAALEEFLVNLFNQPFESASRTSAYGWQQHLRQIRRRQVRLDELTSKCSLLKRLLVKLGWV